MELAPIVLFVYNRPSHTLQTLNALKANTLASKSTLYIYADGPKNGDLTNEIKEVRTILTHEKWCAEVHIILSEINLGLANSVINGVSSVIKKHKKVIVLEDDIITGNYFLEFMNESLNTYKCDPKVFGVSGYKYPTLNEIKKPTYFLPIASSWSYGTWLDRWELVNFKGEALLQEINSKGLQKKINFGNYEFYQMLKDQIEGKNDSWAIRFYTSMFLNKGLFLFPNQSLVQNIGFDNSGTHCNEDNFFSTINVFNGRIPVEKISINKNERIVRNVSNSFKKSGVSKIKPGYIKRIVRRIKLIFK